MSTRRDWPAKGAISLRMGSPGSAQVTRCRLLEQWNGIEVRTIGSTLHLKLTRP